MCLVVVRMSVVWQSPPLKVSGGLCNLDGCYSVHRPSPCPACPSIPVILPPSIRSSAIWGLSIPPTAPAATATIWLFRPVSGPSDRSFRSSADIWPLFLLLSSPSLAGTLLLRPLLRRVLWSSPSAGRRHLCRPVWWPPLFWPFRCLILAIFV